MLKWIKTYKNTLFLVLGYLTLGVILLTVFLYLTFPWQKLTAFIVAQAEKATASSIEFKESEVRFPLKLIWTGVVVSPRAAAYSAQDQNRHPVRVAADRVTVEWALVPLLKRRLELLWTIEAAGGKGRGLVAAQPTDQGMQYQFRGDVEDLRLERLIEYMAPNSYGIEGVIRVTAAQFDFVGKEFLKGSGSAALEILDARIAFLDVPFTRIKGDLSMKAGSARLENVQAQGPVLELVGGGDILFRPNLQDSLVNFNSRTMIRRPEGLLAFLVDPSKGSENAIELAVRGTFNRPTLFKNGTAIYTFSSS
jgi:type II secretion system protein N